MRLKKDKGIEIIEGYLLWMELMGGKAKHSSVWHFGDLLSSIVLLKDFLFHYLNLAQDISQNLRVQMLKLVKVHPSSC